MESLFSLPSLGFLIPPLRMMSAFMWQSVRQGNTKLYGKLEEFVSMVTEVVPELLNNRQRCLLILALRGQVTLKLLLSGRPDDIKAVQTHLDRLRSHGVKQSKDAVFEAAEANFLKLVQNLVDDPEEREHFFKVVFPVEFGSSFEMALQTLVCHLLSRLEELLPVPDFKQTASLISAAPSVLEDYMRCVSHEDDLSFLLQNHQFHRIVKLPRSAPSQTEDRLLHSLSFPFISGQSKANQPPRRVAHKCPHCGRCFVYRYEMLEHQRLHTGENPYKCSQCDKTFRRSSDMSTHRRTQCLNAAYVCIKCGSCFGSVRERVSHRCGGSCSQARQNRSQADQKFECPQCGNTFKWQNSLKKHLENHTKEKVFNCRYCGEGPFTGFAELRAHQKVHDGEEKPFQCKHCGKCFSSQGWLHGHEQRHSQKRSHICLSCGKGFKCKADLKLHMRTHTGERPYQCTYCEKRFSVNGNLTIHIRTHTGEKPFLCSDCGKAFCSAGELQIHRRTHTGERPYKCTVCQKGFTMASKVTLHMRLHTGERPYVCHQCGKAFSRGAELKKHIMNHTGVRPFPCHLCSKTYTCQYHLKRHLKTHNDSESGDIRGSSVATALVEQKTHWPNPNVPPKPGTLSG
ncbi:hypothetical protein DPEC_G00053920 [Dallia pectoralis]|uniref:Uncharacterized protein n=1 Tax=Dallia pectoralis TaxID=75939 RepID=A0ACC2H550_DALPE|nr:hypothetical protein DPEC_G00053920 [Dallia pectoralis]